MSISYNAADMRADLSQTTVDAPALPIQFVLLIAVALAAVAACFVTGVDLATIVP
jgi:hypothetical protein